MDAREAGTGTHEAGTGAYEAGTGARERVLSPLPAPSWVGCLAGPAAATLLLSPANTLLNPN